MNHSNCKNETGNVVGITYLLCVSKYSLEHCSITQLGELSIDGGCLFSNVSCSSGLECLLLLLVLPVQFSLCLSLGLKSGNDILVLPASLGGETANWSISAVWLQLDLTEAWWQDWTTDFIVWGWNTLKSLNIQTMYTFIRDKCTLLYRVIRVVHEYWPKWPLSTILASTSEFRLTNLQVLECTLTTVGLVWEHTTDDMLEHLWWWTTVEWTAGWLGQVTLAKVLHNLELVTVEVTRDNKSLASDNNDLLA